MTFPELQKPLLIKIIVDLFLFQRDKVEAFVSKVNGAMRVRHELEKLKTTAERIHNNYNVVEAVNEEMEKVLFHHDPFSSKYMTEHIVTSYKGNENLQVGKIVLHLIHCHVLKTNKIVIKKLQGD